MLLDMALKRTRPRRRASITSLIDVIFLLLISFLLSTSYTPPEAELAPALQAEQVEGGRSADLQPQIVRVDLFGGEPGFRLAERVFRDAEVLRGVLAELPKEGGVFIEGADAVSVRWAAAAIQALRQRVRDSG